MPTTNGATEQSRVAQRRAWCAQSKQLSSCWSSIVPCGGRVSRQRMCAVLERKSGLPGEGSQHAIAEAGVKVEPILAIACLALRLAPASLATQGRRHYSPISWREASKRVIAVRLYDAALCQSPCSVMDLDFGNLSGMCVYTSRNCSGNCSELVSAPSLSPADLHCVVCRGRLCQPGRRGRCVPGWSRRQP